MKLYTQINHYDPAWRKELFPLLKPYIGKPQTYTSKECVAQYGFELHTFQLVPEEDENATWVLPMSWNYYRLTGQLKLAGDFIEKAARQSITVISFTSGDFGVKVPQYSNILVYRQSGNKSRLPHYHRGLPVFIEDPLQKYFHLDTPVLRDYTMIPAIGFCGQTNSSVTNAIKEIGRVGWRNLRHYLRKNFDEPQQLLSSSYIRAAVLGEVKKSTFLKANFIERKKYRAGAVDEKSKAETTMEFYRNMMDSDYIICVRGGGNFSVRFYETLAMARIPVFVNTDCLLPLEDKVDWKKHLVWIESNSIKSVEEHITDFHNSHTPASFKALQMANRRLWEDKLRSGTFFQASL